MKVSRNHMGVAHSHFYKLLHLPSRLIKHFLLMTVYLGLLSAVLCAICKPKRTVSRVCFNKLQLSSNEVWSVKS